MISTKAQLLKKSDHLITRFGYDAVKHNPGRKRPRTSIQSEEKELKPHDRQKLVATTKDQIRNIALVSWMVRKHLDYVTQFSFHPMTGDEKLNDDLDWLWNNWSRKDNCDIAGRHSINRMVRLFEASKITDGDAGLYKLSTGMLQGVEGCSIAKPYDVKNQNVNENGLVINKYGRVSGYAVTKEENHRAVLDKIVSAKHMLFDGYFTRFNQTRGVSPLASAINLYQDLVESWEYQLIKAKMHAMFGVAIHSDSAVAASSGFDERDSDTGQAGTSSTVNNGGYEFELKPGLKLELEQGDRIDTIESKTPSAEFRDYTELMVRIGLLALDIPYSFYDSRQASYSAMKQDRVEYETSSRSKKKANHDIYMQIGEWKIDQWKADGLIKHNGLIKFDFRAAGRPWIEEVKEIDAAIKRIDSGLSSRTREAIIHGDNFKEILKELEEEKTMIKASGVNIVSGMPGQPTLGERDASIEKTEADTEKTETEGGDNE